MSRSSISQKEQAIFRTISMVSSHAEHPARKISIFRLALISERPNEGSLYPVPTYKVKCLRLVSFSGWCRTPSPLIQARELIYSCSHERAGASLEAASAAVLTELAPVLMGLGRESRRDKVQTISDNNGLSYLYFFDGL